MYTNITKRTFLSALLLFLQPQYLLAQSKAEEFSTYTQNSIKCLQYKDFTICKEYGDFYKIEGYNCSPCYMQVSANILRVFDRYGNLIKISEFEPLYVSVSQNEDHQASGAGGVLAILGIIVACIIGIIVTDENVCKDAIDQNENEE